MVYRFLGLSEVRASPRSMGECILAGWQPGWFTWQRRC
jgi:hypothetical protein